MPCRRNTYRLPAVLAALVVGLVGAAVLRAHPGHEHDERKENGAGSPHIRAAAVVKVDGHVEITERDGYRYVTADGLPDHETGRFPNRNNPNTIRAQDYDFRAPLVPRPVAGPRPFVGGWVFGIARNGVPFDPLTAEFWRGDRRSPWRYEAISPTVSLGLDEHLAHVQPSGAYHYHGLPTGLVAGGAKKTGASPLVLLGYAADGYPIYSPYGKASAVAELKKLKSSYRLKTGERPAGPFDPGGKYDGTFTLDYEYVAGSGDLDESNGFTGPTPEFPNGTYYYVLTEEFPYIPRYFRGEPDPSFRHAAARGGPRGPPPGLPPPRRPAF